MFKFVYGGGGCGEYTHQPSRQTHSTHIIHLHNTHITHSSHIHWMMFVYFFSAFCFPLWWGENKGVVVWWWGCAAVISAQHVSSHNTHNTQHTHHSFITYSLDDVCIFFSAFVFLCGGGRYLVVVWYWGCVAIPSAQHNPVHNTLARNTDTPQEGQRTSCTHVVLMIIVYLFFPFPCADK